MQRTRYNIDLHPKILSKPIISKMEFIKENFEAYSFAEAELQDCVFDQVNFYKTNTTPNLSMLVFHYPED